MKKIKGSFWDLFRRKKKRKVWVAEMIGPPFSWRQAAQQRARLILPFGFEIVESELIPEWMVLLIGEVSGQASVVWVDAKEDNVRVYPVPSDMRSLISQCRPWQGEASPSRGEDQHGKSNT